MIHTEQHRVFHASTHDVCGVTCNNVQLPWWDDYALIRILPDWHQKISALGIPLHKHPGTLRERRDVAFVLLSDAANTDGSCASLVTAKNKMRGSIGRIIMTSYDAENGTFVLQRSKAPAVAASVPSQLPAAPSKLKTPSLVRVCGDSHDRLTKSGQSGGPWIVFDHDFYYLVGIHTHGFGHGAMGITFSHICDSLSMKLVI